MIGEAIGRPVRYETMRLEALEAGMTAHGASEGMARAMVAMMRAKGAGMDSFAPTAPESLVRALVTPTTFRQWCEDVLKPTMQG